MKRTQEAVMRAIRFDKLTPTPPALRPAAATTSAEAPAPAAAPQANAPATPARPTGTGPSETPAHRA
jgi:hypothetical protein